MIRSGFNLFFFFFFSICVPFFRKKDIIYIRAYAYFLLYFLTHFLTIFSGSLRKQTPVFVSQSPTEIHAPRGCARIRKGNLSACADRIRRASLAVQDLNSVHGHTKSTSSLISLYFNLISSPLEFLQVSSSLVYPQIRISLSFLSRETTNPPMVTKPRTSLNS